MKNNLVVMIVAFLLITVLISGCDSNESASKVSSSNESGLIKSVPAINSESAPSSENDYTKVLTHHEIQTNRAKLVDGRAWAPLAISDDGDIFGFTAATQNKLSEIICYHLTSDKTELIYTVKDKYQPLYFYNNNDYLIWTEYLPPNSNGNARIVLFDKKSKKAITLNSQAQNQPLSDDHIALGKDFVLWSEGVTDNNKTIYKILKYDIKSAKTSIFKDNATNPVIGDNFVAWIGPENGSQQNSAIFVQNLKDGSVRQITNGEYPMYLAAYGDMLAYSGYSNLDYLNGTKKDIYENELILYQNGNKKIIEKSKEHDYEFPYISNHFVSWDENSKKRVYCIDIDKIAELPSEYGGAFVSDNYIMWASNAINGESKDQVFKDGMYLLDINVINTLG